MKAICCESFRSMGTCNTTIQTHVWHFGTCRRKRNTRDCHGPNFHRGGRFDPASRHETKLKLRPVATQHPIAASHCNLIATWRHLRAAIGLEPSKPWRTNPNGHDLKIVHALHAESSVSEPVQSASESKSERYRGFNGEIQSTRSVVYFTGYVAIRTT